MKNHKATFLIAASLFTSVVYAGPSYKFTVSCDNGHSRSVSQWNTGDIDPGKEFLRVSTGTKNPGCSVSEYNDATDRNLPLNQYSGPTGVVEGIPLVGQIIAKIFGF
jgi:hypothetical protein